MPTPELDQLFSVGVADGFVGATAAQLAQGIALEDAQRWTLDKMAIVDGKLASSTVGVAYCFETWIHVADGFSCSPGGVRTPPALDAAEVEAAVTAQGALVRKLKEEDGLANGDPAVKAAVAELLRLKAVLEEL